MGTASQQVATADAIEAALLKQYGPTNNAAHFHAYAVGYMSSLLASFATGNRQMAQEQLDDLIQKGTEA